MGITKMKITKRQLRRIITEFREMDPSEPAYDTSSPGVPPHAPYEDNQTKMVRRYLALRGEEEEVERMSVEEIESLAADLRLLPPSTKKRWGIYDLREAPLTTGQPKQLSFSDAAVREADSLLSLLDTFTNRYRKLTFEFPDSVDDVIIDVIEEHIMDAADKLRDVKWQMQDRGIK